MIQILKKIVFITLSCFFTGQIISQSTKEVAKMNILFIAVDDLRPELNSYGQSYMITPNIDQLAQNGVLFQRAYCQQAICMASRASILSGIRPEHMKLYNCRSLEDLAPDIPTLNEHFEKHGYSTLGVGKVYHHESDHREQFGENWHDPTDQWKGRGYLSDEAISEIAANGKFASSKIAKGPAYEMLDVPDNYYIDGANTDFAIKKLNKLKKQDKPFFMAMGYHKPHLPWCAPKKYWDMYPIDKIALSPAPEFPENLTDYSLTNWGELRGYFGIPQGKNQIPDELAIQLRRAYFASVSYMDAQVGRLINALEKNGLADNTIIVLWGDHGWKLGDHHAWSKHTNFEIDTRVPLIISVPGSKNGGEKSSSFAELVDVYPTLCDLTGIEKPDHLQGQSLAPILNYPDKKISDAAYSIFPRNRTNDKKTITGFSMRTDQYRYTEWIHLASGRIMASELYDHKNDPLENKNVVQGKKYEQMIQTLSKKLHNKYDDAIFGLKKQPEVYLYNPAELLFAKQLYKKNQEPFLNLVEKLSEEADKLMNIKPYSVMQKEMVPPSKDLHDFYSLGIYWWPNPDTKDGLPYVRHDGKRNPEYLKYDGAIISDMANDVMTLSMAYFYTSHEPYAEKAYELLYAWFLNPDTKMNPHLKYGQAIPGRVTGRGIGIIETACFVDVISAMGFLKNSEAFTSENRKKMKAWFKEYTEWLITSEHGWDERMWHNNHGSSYDSQVASYSLFTGKDSVARMILDSVKIKRIDRQIEPDGSQPWELKRTKSMGYSLKNIDHLMENAILAQHYEIDLWNYESEDGGSIKKAIHFLIPYMMDEKEWEYEQYGGIESMKSRFFKIIWIANKYLDDELINKTFKALYENNSDQYDINLLYPALNAELEMDTR